MRILKNIFECVNCHGTHTCVVKIGCSAVEGYPWLRSQFGFKKTKKQVK